MKIVVGTRGSELALAQARMVEQKILAAFPGMQVEQKIIHTRGDQRLDLSLQNTGALDKGLFTKELEVALSCREIDLAVHSLKDLPTGLPGEFRVGAILPREDPADVLVSKRGRFGEGKEVFRVATSSPRRALQFGEQLAGEGRRSVIREIRGNVPTRLRKLQGDPELDGVVLAFAGLRRLGVCDEAGESLFPVEFASLRVERLPAMLPAPGQGAVAVEIRSDDEMTAGVVRALHCGETAICVETERLLLQELGGGCHLALGAKAEIREGRLFLDAVYYPDASLERVLRGKAEVAVGEADTAVRSVKNHWNL